MLKMLWEHRSLAWVYPSPLSGRGVVESGRGLCRQLRYITQGVRPWDTLVLLHYRPWEMVLAFCWRWNIVWQNIRWKCKSFFPCHSWSPLRGSTELGVEQCISLYRVKGDNGKRLGPASCHLPGQCHIRRVPDSWLSKLGIYSILWLTCQYQLNKQI